MIVMQQRVGLTFNTLPVLPASAEMGWRKDHIPVDGSGNITADFDSQGPLPITVERSGSPTVGPNGVNIAYTDYVQFRKGMLTGDNIMIVRGYWDPSDSAQVVMGSPNSGLYMGSMTQGDQSGNPVSLWGTPTGTVEVNGVTMTTRGDLWAALCTGQVEEVVIRNLNLAAIGSGGHMKPMVYPFGGAGGSVSTGALWGMAYLTDANDIPAALNWLRVDL